MRLNDQFLALNAECTNAVNLARTGLNLLGEMKYSVNGIPPVFSCLALGSEKLLKLTYGVREQAKGESWPSLATMRKFVIVFGLPILQDEMRSSRIPTWPLMFPWCKGGLIGLSVIHGSINS